ncbi:MAG: hypothetical protein PHU25_22430 [Deltaproteobacteria bacterium]|nr:hypothetical protein [Deltaproteobacteria bacterium]
MGKHWIIAALFAIVLVSTSAAAKPISSPDVRPLVGCTTAQDCGHVTGPLSLNAFKGETTSFVDSLSADDKVEKWFDPFTNQPIDSSRR